MWDLQEARVRAEVIYRQERCRLAVVSEHQARQVVRRSLPAYGAPGLPSWRRWLPLAWLTLASLGLVPDRTPAARVPRA
jgi:hypothetical protein